MKGPMAEAGSCSTEGCGQPEEKDRTGEFIAEVQEAVDARPRSGALLRRWTPILVKFASVQAVVQVVGFAAGILVIRNLPKREYALYTLWQHDAGYGTHAGRQRHQ